jgi:hypothetical protein
MHCPVPRRAQPPLTAPARTFGRRRRGTPLPPGMARRAMLLAATFALLLAQPARADSTGLRITSMTPGALAVTMMSPAQISRMAVEYNFTSPAKLLGLLSRDRELHISPALKLAYKCASLAVKATARRSLLEGQEGEEEGEEEGQEQQQEQEQQAAHGSHHHHHHHGDGDDEHGHDHDHDHHSHGHEHGHEHDEHGHEGEEHGHQHHTRKLLLQGGELPAADPLEAPGRALLQQSAASLVMQDPALASLQLGPTGVPVLHSRPSATRKIFMDFDGHTTT